MKGRPVACREARHIRLLLLLLFLAACDLRFGALPTATPIPTTPPNPILTVVYVKDGDLFAWHEGDQTPRKIASTGVIQPFLARDGRQVAFTRGQQADKNMLWVVGTDGTGETQLVKPEDLRSVRGGHPQIYQVGWLDNTTVYLNTYQQYSNGTAQSDDLYRVSLIGGDPQLILPAGAGGDFALSPDGQQIAVVRAGIYDTQKGQAAVSDAAGTQVSGTLTFTALRPPDQAPFYLPLAWNADSTFVRVPVPNLDNDRVALWRIPVKGDPAIFGYISAMPDGLPVWLGNQMIYLRAGSQPNTFDLILADANGENEQVYDSGNIRNLRWFPAGDHFTYEKDGLTQVGKRGEKPTWHRVGRTLLLADERLVFLMNGELSVTELAANKVLSVADGLPADTFFDAVVAS